MEMRKYYLSPDILQQVEVLLETPVMSGEGGDTPSGLTAFGPNDDGEGGSGVPNINWVDFD